MPVSCVGLPLGSFQRFLHLISFRTAWTAKHGLDVLHEQRSTSACAHSSAKRLLPVRSALLSATARDMPDVHDASADAGSHIQRSCSGLPKPWFNFASKDFHRGDSADPVAPSDVLHIVWEQSQMSMGGQQDAHEFFLAVHDLLHRHYNGTIPLRFLS